MSQQQHTRQQLRAACLRGDINAALRLLSGSQACCTGGDDESTSIQQFAALLDPFEEDGRNTVLHYLCAGEPLGLGGCLLISLTRFHSRTQPAGQWPARHQKRRAQLLACLLLQQPRLVLLAGCRNAAGVTPLHAAVASESLYVLALLLAALRHLLGLESCSSQQQAEPPAPACAAALQLIMSVPDAQGLTPLELALQSWQWPAVRLLSAAAQGSLPLSQPQMEACSLVQRSLGGSGGFSHRSSGDGTAGTAGSSSDGIHVSASGPTVTDALGGLLSKLWDAFGTAPVAPAAAGSSSQLHQGPQAEVAQQPQQEQSGRASGHGDSQGGQQRDQQSGAVPPLLQLELRPLSQADVLVLAAEAEQRALAAALCATSAAAAAAPATAGQQQVAASSGSSEESNSDAARAPAAAASTSPSQALEHCIVCFEDCPPAPATVLLPCGHKTCDECWSGVLLASIDEGDPNRAACPQPGCATQLPSATAARLLPPPAVQRFSQLLAQRYLATHPQTMRCCPQPACGSMLHLPSASLPVPPDAATPPTQVSPGAAGARQAPSEAPAACEAAAAAAVAKTVDGAGLDARCGACGGRFCWQCGEEAHEPASCAQMRRWEEELSALRRAAPSADREWLSANTKRCPGCRAHIQKVAGCNHVTCRQCGHHFCWQCGRPWAQHSAETGGFYFCSLEADARQAGELPEYSGLGGGGGGGLPGPLAWLAGVWGSVKLAAQQHQLQRHLRAYLRHSGGGAALHAAAAHMQLLLAAAGVLGLGGGAHAGGKPAGAVAPQGLELLGVRAADASRMSAAEWGDLVAASAASAADAAAAAAAPTLPVPAARAAAEAGLQAALAGSSADSDGPDSAAAYLEQLASAVVRARALLQHSAVALHQLPSGPHRRHLQQLSGGLQRRLEQLEPLLLALPEREAVQAAQQQQQGTQQPQQQPGNNNSDSGGNGGLTGWLLSRLYGVEPPAWHAAGPSAPERHPALASLTPEVLLQQLRFAAAVHQQRPAVEAAVGAMQGDMRQLVSAGRAGLYCS